MATYPDIKYVVVFIILCILLIHMYIILSSTSTTTTTLTNNNQDINKIRLNTGSSNDGDIMKLKDISGHNTIEYDWMKINESIHALKQQLNESLIPIHMHDNLPTHGNNNDNGKN